MEKVVLTTGGTGGHIFPALAVAEELRRRNSSIRLLFIGSLYGPEAKLATAWHIPFEGLQVRGFLGRGLKAVPAALHMTKAIVQACSLLSRFHPDAIAGFGGYASFAPMLAAKLMRIPTILHEQNAIAGTGNRILAKLANRVCVSLPGTKGFSQETVVTGNPVRTSISALYGKTQKDFSKRRLLVLGGSQGAHALNMFIAEILPALHKMDMEIRHQCGQNDVESLREIYRKNGYSPDCVSAFIEDMASAYQWASLAICRAGASTIAELCASGTPALLVPFPAAIHNHQTLNAKILTDAGAAVLVPENSLEAKNTIAIIDKLFEESSLAEMSRKALSLARNDAASLLTDQLEAIAGK